MSNRLNGRATVVKMLRDGDGEHGWFFRARCVEPACAEWQSTQRLTTKRSATVAAARHNDTHHS